jgi:ubiquinone/menaquinone biosynthesis C-methylase UbiE
MTTARPQYVLGSDEQEIARLDAQAAFYEAATDLLLREADLPRGARVLDLGTGLGHVARLAAKRVGPGGEVVGIDADERLLRVARERTAAAELQNVRFERADVYDFRDAEPFDAVVGRLLLFHLPDPVRVLRHHADALEPGGRVLMIDFDAGTVRSEPPVALLDAAGDFIFSSFCAAGAEPTIGSRLALLLRQANLDDIATLGIQSYLAPDDPRGPALIGGVVRTLAAARPPAGLDPETFEQRLGYELQAADAVLLPPALVGAWGRRRDRPAGH